LKLLGAVRDDEFKERHTGVYDALRKIWWSAHFMLFGTDNTDRICNDSALFGSKTSVFAFFDLIPTSLPGTASECCWYRIPIRSIHCRIKTP
jgi:hypothetical protein